MWKQFVTFAFLLCLVLERAQCQRFLVVGSNTLSYQDKYSVLVLSSGYSTPTNLEIKIYGKLNDGKRYENVKNATLKGNGLQKVEFDLKNQAPGYYFIKVKTGEFNKTKRLDMNTKKSLVFVQTDKPIYKPGDKVRFRVVVLSSDTKPYSVASADVYINDASSNRIKTYEKVTFSKGVYIQELQLSKEPVLGVWSIRVKVNNETEYTKNFEIAKYVLPKFDVKIVTKNKIVRTEDIVVSIEAKYTYGKNVEGTAVVSAKLDDYNTGPEVQKTLDNSTKTVSFNVEKDLKLKSTYYKYQNILITVTFTEALTGIMRKTTANVKVYEVMHQIILSGSDNVLKPDLPFVLTAFVKDINEVPVTDDKEPIIFSVTLHTSKYVNYDVTYEEIYLNFEKFLKNGVAAIPITAFSNVSSIYVQASYKSVSEMYTENVMKTASNQYLEIKVPSETLTAKKSTQIEIISNVNINIVNYLIFGRNKVVAYGQLTMTNSTSFKFFLLPTIEMMPTTKMVAFYITTSGEIISDSKILNFDNELNNFVNIELSQTEVKPSSTLSISVNSQPLSYVGLLGVDQSVLLLKSGNDIDANYVNNEMSQYFYPNQYNNDWQEENWYKKYTDFKATGSVIFTNANDEYTGYWDDTAAASESSMNPMSTEPYPSESAPPTLPPLPTSIPEFTTRTEFPETFLYENIDNINGKTSITSKVPDTITSWIITGFSVNSNNGLGITKAPSKLNVFMPFFIYLNLPYSIKRGETIPIQAIIFNYMNKDYTATVTMFNEKQEYEFAEPAPNKASLSKTITSKSNSGITVNFIIKPLKIGYITLKIEASTTVAGDRVEQQLLVEPEGITRYKNEAMLVDLRNQSSFSKSVSIIVSNFMVPDSLKIESSLIGDVLGPALDNLDSLINMPTGCGEQNMLYLVPDIIVLDYLTNVNKLNVPIKEKLKNFLEIGYQRELSYRRLDGSFSIWGNRDQVGSTWLTAFVARSFNQASKYITVDQNVIAYALNFLKGVQSSDGSFQENGFVHDRSLQGGSSSGAGFTAYVLLTFLENEQLASAYNDTINSAVNNILSHVNEIDDVYTMAITAYTLYLAGENLAADTILQNLDLLANNTGGMRHWDKTTNDYYIKSLSIETTSYVLLAYLKAGRDIDALLIAKWLILQRNSLGGFESTQDSVVGLLALSKIAAKMTSKTTNLKVDFKYQSTVKTFNINQANALVLQKLDIPSEIKNISVSGSGSGLALAQISYKYNVNGSMVSNIFIIKAQVAKLNNSFTLEICISINDIDQSNMAVMEVSTPSGYVFDVEIIKNLTGSYGNIKKVELIKKNTFINVYFDNIQSQKQCLKVNATNAFNVKELKPASIVVYDYYENDFRSEAFYAV